MNLSIITNKINVFGEQRKIVLSGINFESKNKKAANSTNPKFNGEKGNDGRAGNSSGNIALLTKEFYNESNLRIELNGGNGEDGEEGGNGCDGNDGYGVSESDINNLIISYKSLYWSGFNHFNSYSPSSNWTLTESDSKASDFVFRKYKDEHGRKMTYSYARDKGVIYSTYDLFFIIEGSNGCCGSAGGVNGVGGEGGYRGTSIIENPETGETFKLSVIRNAGAFGNDGKIGKSGKSGNNGNDLALIDRSQGKNSSKFYEGDSDHKLSWDYVYEAETKSRLNGYRRYIEKKSACFIKFGSGERTNTMERETEKATETTSYRTSHSKAVAKASILIDELITESTEIFGQENAFLDDACKDATEKFEDEDEAEETEEAEETVNEEVVILRQKENIQKLSKFITNNDKGKRTKFEPEEFVTHILKDFGRGTECGKVAQFMFDLFTIELNPEQMKAITLQILFQRYRFREAMQDSFKQILVAALQQRINDGKTFDEIKEFLKDFEWRCSKKIKTSKLPKMFERCR
uniref:Uncharacterized protein n=1 Tax=Panagrolaimus superbus TaxID=310955 RepID=A0A914Y194_9BILA